MKHRARTPLHGGAGIKLYNRTAWRGSRLRYGVLLAHCPAWVAATASVWIAVHTDRVEKANESYLERLQRDWAASDGESAAPVADDRLTAE
eukprot:42526-Eustigmatos_ZCMA.PRE.1